AITWAGAGDISVPTTGLPTGAAAWSLVAWVKIAAAPSGNNTIASFGTVTANECAQIGIASTGKPYCGINGTQATASAAISTGAYHLIVGTYDGTTLRIWVDNGSAVTQAGSANIILAGANVAQLPDGSTRFNGQIDECAFYSVALNATQIG